MSVNEMHDSEELKDITKPMVLEYVNEGVEE
jgi:hypothetical protein